VIGILKAAFVHGRLTKDELDTRAGQAFTARTYAELAALRADGPTPCRLGVLPGAVPAADEQCSQGGHMSGHCGSRAGGPVVHRGAAFFLLFTPFYFMALAVLGAETLVSWREKRSQSRCRSSAWRRTTGSSTVVYGLFGAWLAVR
jgi:hypothetical protein